MNNKNVTLLQSASLVSSPERNAVTGASQSVRRHSSSDKHENDDVVNPQEGAQTHDVSR
jgi:hypothetical protein